MARARRKFKESYFEPVRFALELVDRVRQAVTEAILENGLDPDDEGYEVNELGEPILTAKRRARDELLGEIERKVWEEIRSDPSVRERLANLARGWCNVDASSVQP